jgi:hypothetical protein
MAYPVLATSTGSKQQPIEDLVVDVWPNGAARGRSYFTSGRYAWDLVHGVISDADRQTLQTFYVANRLLMFDYVSPWDGVTYHNVGFVKPPEYVRLPGLWWTVKTSLRQMV